MFLRKFAVIIICVMTVLLCLSGCSHSEVDLSSQIPILESEAPDEFDKDVKSLDLSDIEPSQVAETVEKLSKMRSLETVELMDSQGNSKLSIEDVKTLSQAAPNAIFHYTFELFGKKVSTTDETVEFVNEKIGNEGEEELRNALDIMRGCKYFKLEECGFDSEVLAKVRDDYPDTKIVWRIHVGKRSFMTDAEMVRAVYHFDDTNSYELRYCTDVKYMDLGHNTDMRDISFIEFMPKLEIVILSGSPIDDISAFKNHENLMFLELAFCSYVKDVSPLASCKNLKFLNISFTGVKDVSPLDDIKLERLSYLSSGLSQKEKDEIQKKHPDCWVTFKGKQPYGKGWRYDDDGYTYSDIYKKVREVFKYDELEGNE